MKQRDPALNPTAYTIGALAALLLSQSALADGGIRFHDIAADAAAGLVYERTESATAELWRQFTDGGIMTPFDLESSSPRPPSGAARPAWRSSTSTATATPTST